MHDSMYCVEIGSSNSAPPPPLQLELKDVAAKSTSSSCCASSCSCDTMKFQPVGTSSSNNILIADNDEYSTMGSVASASTTSSSTISHFEVQGICCSSELPMLKSVLKRIPAFEEIVSYNPTMKKVVVQHSSSIQPTDISTVLRKHGYVCRYLSPSSSEENEEDNNQPKFYASFRFYSLVLSGVFWLLSLLSNVLFPAYFEYFGYLSLVCGVPPILRKTWASLRQCHFDANCMMLCASLGALCVGEAEEAASVVFLFSSGEYLEHGITSKGRKALKNICNKDVMYARVVQNNNNTHSLIPASQVSIGSKLLIIPGEKIPCDGAVLEGSTYIDESLLTGESKPVFKSQNEKVNGGSINVGPSNICIETSSLESESAHSRFIRLIENAQQYKSPTEKCIDNFARIYTPCVLSIAFIMCTIPWIVKGTEIGREWFHAGLIFIAIACPCAITIASPVTYVSALTSLASHGVVVRGGSLLETLGQITNVVFDKTGTLTYGLFHVQHLEIIEQEKNVLFKPDQILSLLAQMEELSAHPLSHAIVNTAREKIKDKGDENLLSYSMANHTVLAGEGITAIINNEYPAFVGNERLFQRLELLQTLKDEHFNQISEWKKDGSSVGFFGVQDVGILAMYCVSDRIRKEAPDVVNRLNSLNLELLMLTGDSENASRKVGRELGLDENSIKSQLLPEEKLEAVMALMNQEEFDTGNSSTIQTGFLVNDKYSHSTEQENKIEEPKSRCSCFPWKKRRRRLVLMVGDGLNDAPALTAVDVGVAMGSGATMAMEIADVTLMDSNLDKLVLAIEIGKKVNATILENIAFALLLKIIIVFLTVCGKMTLLGAIGCDVGGMLIVILNGMKLLSSMNTHKNINDSSKINNKHKDRIIEIEEEINPLMESEIEKEDDDVWKNNILYSQGGKKNEDNGKGMIFKNYLNF